jgi:transcriptional regulator with XRE-family HTH domain
MPQISIKAARVNAGLTQKQAAEKLGISDQTLSHYEKNSGLVKQATLEKMYSIYKIDKKQILLK